MLNPRHEAAKVLMKIEKDEAFSALAIADYFKNISFNDSRDTSFAVSLVYGVLEHKITIDYNIGLYLSTDIKKLKNNVLNIIRIGAYQILYTDKIPDSAAVNEAVKSVKKCNASYAGGLANAILRKISSNGLILPSKDDKLAFYSVKYSVDKSIAESLLNDYGEDALVSFFEAFCGRRPIFIRHNTLICSESELVSSLESSGVIVCKTELEGCFSVEKTGNITELDAYKKGYFYVQDMSSQLCCRLVNAAPGNTVVDCCAAPGGKSFTIAQYLKNQGELISCDIYEHKTKLISNTAKRLGIENLRTICCDARNLKKQIESADIVLCDVPCSGLGVIGRKPEIRYKSSDSLKNLPIIQKEILFSCAEMVKKGGTLIYSTCTLNKKENELICNEFIQEFSDFSIAKDDLYRNFTEDYLTVYPTKNGGDGFFIAKFVRG